jgi:hypothetical protein
MKTEIQRHKDMINKYYLIPLSLETELQKAIEDYKVIHPNEKVNIVGYYVESNTPIRGESTILSAQGVPILYGFLDGLSNVEMALQYFILNTDLPTQLSFEFEQRMLARGVIGFESSEQLLNYIRT